MTKRKKKQEQLTLQTQGWGGVRHGAGRPKKKNAKVGHKKRPVIKKTTPLHVTLRLQKGLPNLRTKEGFRIFRSAVLGARKSGLKVLQFALLGNHFHLLVEAKNNSELTRAMRSLNGRLTKLINRWVSRSGMRTGAVFTERYHLQVLNTPAQVKRAMLYIFSNAAKHFKREVVFDRYCSYAVFNQPLKLDRNSALAKKIWKKPRVPADFKRKIDMLLSVPKSWMASVGWKRVKAA